MPEVPPYGSYLPVKNGATRCRSEHYGLSMNDFVWVLYTLAGVCFFFCILYWVIRTAVAHGIEDVALRRRQVRQDEIRFAQEVARHDRAG